MKLNWFKAAQEQQSFGFYNDPKYQGENPKQDSYFKEWAETKGLSPKLLSELLPSSEVSSIYEIKMLLNQFGFDWKEVNLKRHTIIVVSFDEINETYVICDFEDPEIEKSENWLSNIFDHHLYDYIDYEDFNQNFWDDISDYYRLYHATDTKNKEEILKNGLLPMDKTRGMSNRSMGSAVFTTDDPDIVTDHYGPLVFEIDVAQMKKDGYMPTVTMEQPFEDVKAREQLASILGIQDTNYSSEYASEGLYENTVAFYGKIPPKYLKIHQE